MLSDALMNSTYDGTDFADFDSEPKQHLRRQSTAIFFPAALQGA
jgi:hypothetical protein